MRTVLVVDDDDSIRDAVAFILGKAGYRVLQAENGAEALALLEQGPAPTLILLDLRMPIMDGATFVREQQRRPSLARVPVVLVSAEGDLADQALALGVPFFLAKPFAFLDLLALVARVAPG